MKAPAHRSSPKSGDWWRTFFTSEMGKVLFSMPASQSHQEVCTVIQATHLKKGARVLDLCCGIGRHSVEFGKQGMDVTGLDYSPHYVATAQSAVKKHGLDGCVRILRGDMRDLTRYFKPAEFDLVVLLFNSFGYFRDREDDHEVLSQVSKVLKPGGAFVIETKNVFTATEGVLSKLPAKFENIRATGFGREPVKNFFVIDKSIFDRAQRQTYFGWTFIDARKRPAKIKRISWRQNIYSHAEYRNLLEPLGMQITEVWESLAGGTFNPEKSWHQTFVAVKTT
jgi:SAM-dependent methyltransferase